MTRTTVIVTFEDNSIIAQINPKNVDKAVKDIGELLDHDGFRALKIAVAAAQSDELTRQQNVFLAALALWLSCTQTSDGELTLRRAREGGATIACKITDEGNHYNFATKVGLAVNEPGRHAIH
jgi:hypothetical protein